MSAKYDKLKTLLMELFQLDQPDLDFGIYRILHARADEISKFLDEDLLPQVKKAFEQYRSADRAELQKELDEMIAGLVRAKVDPETNEEVIARRRAISDAVDITRLEGEVFDHLYSFFRRYYSEGDFLSKRVYKEGVYALPYEGEEVKLHWANADQYYIKTSEYLRDYAFRLKPDVDESKGEDPMRVHFRLRDASEGEHGNVKEAEGKNRVFILAPDEFLAEDDGPAGKELVIYFEYRPATLSDWPAEVREGKKKPPAQKDLLEVAEARIFGIGDAGLLTWINELRKKYRKADGTESDNSTLAVNLRRYTARNTFDYFIHKDLGSFLRRELDFYIKNEVMHLDDIESDTIPRVEQYLSKIKVIRSIAQKIIDFLAQIEDFQRKLWLKKKFVVEANYCVRLDAVPEGLYPEIIANTDQVSEWIRLFNIDETNVGLLNTAFSVPLSEAFLKANPQLVLDTIHFDPQFVERLLETYDSHSAQFPGILFLGENSDASRLAVRSMLQAVSCFYSDPPFNLGANADFLYRTDYQDSNWLCLLEGRLTSSHAMLSDDALIFIRCDYHGSHLVRDLLESLGYVFKAEVLIDRSRNEAGSPNKMESTYEHLFMFGNTDAPLNKYTVERSLANIKWTGFLMAGDRNPPQRSFLGKEIFPPSGQHFSLVQPKVNKLLDEFFLRLKCRECSCLYFSANDDATLGVTMKSKKHRFKFYDITAETLFHGVREISVCLDCGHDVFKVEYLGSDEVFVNDNWLDIPSYSRRWGFTTENSEELLDRVTEFTSKAVLDLFGGSGTTAAVSMKKNRPWISSEIGTQAVDVIIPRLKAVMAGEESGISKSQKWKGGSAYKYCVLESYEDALNNLELTRTSAQESLLDLAKSKEPDGFREQYMLRYMLDVESRGSQSLLNVEAFTDPTAYKLKVKRPGSDESREVDVDLIETFNWLIGLTVQQITAPRTFSAAFEPDDEGRLQIDGRLRQDAEGPFWFRTVSGTTPSGGRTLVVWRKLTGNSEQDNLVLDTWLTEKLQINPRDMEFDLIYVNGDNNLENIRTESQTWKVRLIEEDFHRLMFDMEDA